ncbi:hypothetical protein [Prauserella cavernicola]|nr:hypothetical protein [Prauserella cavernicola]
MLRAHEGRVEQQLAQLREHQRLIRHKIEHYAAQECAADQRPAAHIT